MNSYSLQGRPEGVLRDAIAKFTGGYVPGDTVYVLQETASFVPCDMCKEKGEVSAVIDGEECLIDCPSCHAVGSHLKKKCRVLKGKVDEITLSLHIEKDNIYTWNVAPIQLTNFPYPLPPDLIYRTRQEAEMKKESLEKEES